MDVGFSSKSQALISSITLPSFSSSHFLLPAFIRREFLGSQPRPPPHLRCRRIRTKLGSRIQSPRCLFHDHVYVDSLLVVSVAVAVCVAIQAINLNNGRRRRDASEFPDKGMFDVLASVEPCKHDIGNIAEEDVQSQSFNTGNDAKLLMKEAKNIIETNENTFCGQVYVCDIKDARLLKFQKTSLASEETFKYKMPSHPGYKFTLVPTDNALMESSEAQGPSYLPVAIHGGTERGNSANISDTSLGELQSSVDVSDMPTMFFEHSCSTISMQNKRREISQDTETDHDTVAFGELLMLSYKGLHRPLANEVNVCDEGKEPGIRSISCFKSVSTVPSHVILRLGRGSHSQIRPAMNVAGFLAKQSPHTAELAERCVPVACFKEGSVNKQKEPFKSNCFARDIRRSLIHNSDKMNISGYHQPNGSFEKDADDPLAYLRTYNRLLHDARLNDCLDLLESMERKGLLDMEKVYHTRFLEVCKSRKAVKEAFRFVKLIRKPTLSTFNMLLSICAHSQDFEGAFQVMLLVKEAGFKPDCKLYTTLISTCAKSGKVDAMFEVFHEMVNAGVEPTVNTYGALIDGCARAGQVAKAFGAYGIMRSKKVQPDRVIFNALITACGQSGAVDRAFDVLAEMMSEPKPIEPDHVTVGALMKTCIQAGQVDRVHEVYRMLHTYNIKGTADVYTIAVRSCSQTGDLKFALSIYDDMTKRGVIPDEMFLSTLVDVAGHAGKVDVAFEVLQNAKKKGIELGNVSYSSLMGACCNAKNWQKALELYEDIKAIKLLPTVSTLNALIKALCDGDQLLKSIEVLHEMKEAGVQPNIVTYSILLVACEKKHEAELGFTIFSEAKCDGVLPNLIMCRCLTGLCLWSFERAYSLGEPIVSFDSGRPQIDNKWTSRAIMAYRETISAGVIPTIEVFSQVLGCLKFPRDTSLRERFIENIGICIDVSKSSNICSLLDGFGEYDPRSFSVLEEAASLGVIPRVSFKESPIIVDARKLQIRTVEVYMLTILKVLKHRLASGSRLPSITILLPIEKTRIESAYGERTINLSGRVGQAVGSLLRRLGLPYQGDESYGKIRINGLTLRRWFKPRLASPSLPGRSTHMSPLEARLAKGITHQQRNIRSRSLE